MTAVTHPGIPVRRRAGWRSAAIWTLAAAFYGALTIVQTWPLVTRLADVLPHDLGDPGLNAWIIWWNAQAVPLTERWWNAPIFFPSSGTLAFSESLLGLLPITAPIQWLGGSPITAYNVAFLLTFPLSALAAHALVARLTGRHDAALIAGLIYGFNPFRIAHFPQIQVMTSYWMPLALLGLHVYVESGRRRWLVLFGAAWLMQALSNGYYLLFFPVLVALWLAWFTLQRASARRLGVIVLAWVVASLPLVPLLWRYRRIHAAFSFQRGAGEINVFGADVSSLLDASPLLRFWRLDRFHQPEGELFPGFTAIALVALLLIHWLWTSKPESRVPRTCAVLLSAAVIFIGIALSALLVGPWAVTVGGSTLLSVRVVSKPLSIGVLLLILALALEPRIASAWRRRSPLMFYFLATAAMYLLCFGPRPRFLGEPFMYRAPYSWLMALPGYDAVRVPARFAMLAALCLSVVAALAFARLTRRGRWSVRAPLAALVVAGVLVDSWIGEMPLPRVPFRLQALESLPARTVVMELPLGDTSADVAAMYRAMYHRGQLVNGYSGYFPRSYEILRRGLELRDPRMFDALAASGPVVVAVDALGDDGSRWSKQLAARPGTVILGEESGKRLYSLPRGDNLPGIDPAARPLPVRSAIANVENPRLVLAFDGDPATRWDGGNQRGVEVVTVDLGSVRTVDGLTMTLGPQLADFPRLLAIDTSQDGSVWSPQWQGSTAAHAFAGAVRQPADVPLTFALPHVPARLVRLRQLGQDPVFYWTIFEMTVFGR
ncbi:MAG: discoidin domain-containing protein [Acidobacteriota bacterium]